MSTRQHLLGLMGIALSLGCLLIYTTDSKAASQDARFDPPRIRMEEGQDFTRIVFPCERPHESSVKSDLERSRFLLTFSKGTHFTAPHLAGDHPLVKEIKTLSDAGERVEVQVSLTSGLVDWVVYRYDRPPRTVLYLKARSTSAPQESPSDPPKSEDVEDVKTKKPEPTIETKHVDPPQAERSVSMGKTSRAEKEEARDTENTPGAKGQKQRAATAGPRARDNDKDVEGLWRGSAADIPEFIRPGVVYPPDFRGMKADERHLYLEALERFRNREFARAKEMASKIVPRKRRSSMAETLAFFKADCDFHLVEDGGDKTYTHAIQSYQEALAQFSESKFVPHAVLMIATGYRRMKFFQEATVQYELLLTKFPENPTALEALFWKGECLFQRGKYEEAKEVFGNFAGKRPRSIHGRIGALRVGDCLYKMGDLNGARRQYGTVLSESSTLSYYPIGSLFLVGRTLIETGDLKEGREILFRAINLDPGSKEAATMMNHIARSYLDENREDEALRANLLLMGSFRRDGSQVADMRLPPSGEAYVDPTDSSQETNLAHEVMYQESLAQVQAGNVDGAVTMLNRILSETPQDDLKQRSLSLLGYCINSLIQLHHGLGDHLEVARFYRENEEILLSTENKDADVLLLVAESFRNLGLLEDALTMYDHVRASGDLADDYILFQIGRVLSLRGDGGTARETLDNFQRDFPRSPYLSEVQKLLGRLSLDMGDYEAAIKSYHLALAHGDDGPDTGRVYSYLGEALKRSGRYQESIEAYEEAIERLSPFRDQPWARILLGESLAELAVHHETHGRIHEAIQCYERIVRVSPSDEQMDWALYRLGESHRKMGNMERMRQAFDDLNERSTDSLWAKLAAWAAADVAFQTTAEPYLTRVQEAMVKTKNE